MKRQVQVGPAMAGQDWGMLIMLSLVWGGSFFFNGVAVRELPTFTIVVGRVLLAALVLLALMRVLKVRLPTDSRIWGSFLVMGLLNNVIPFSLIVWAQSSISSGQASILNATTPLFTVAVAHRLTTDEKMTEARLFGVVVGLAGVAVMMGKDAIQVSGDNIIAQLACLMAAFSYACAGVFGRRFREMKLSPASAATGQLVMSAFVMVPVMLVVDRPWTLPVPGIATVLSLAGLAVLSTALAYVLYFRILARAGATNLLLVTFLVPVGAILLGTTALGEVFSPEQAAGLALIGLGLAAIARNCKLPSLTTGHS